MTVDSEAGAPSTPGKCPRGKRRSQVQRLKARLAQADQTNSVSAPGPAGAKTAFSRNPRGPPGKGPPTHGTRATGVPGCVGCEKSKHCGRAAA
eukprot:3130320-Rhodomonas_salina.1